MIGVSQSSCEASRREHRSDVTGGQEARWDLGFGVCLQVGRSRLGSDGYGPVGSQKFGRF